jgi:hypothetical protein
MCPPPPQYPAKKVEKCQYKCMSKQFSIYNLPCSYDSNSRDTVYTYLAPTKNEEMHQQRISDACQTSNTTRLAIIRSVHAWDDSREGYFDHLP